jgi:hypothetical protein
MQLKAKERILFRSGIGFYGFPFFFPLSYCFFKVSFRGRRRQLPANLLNIIYIIIQEINLPITDASCAFKIRRRRSDQLSRQEDGRRPLEQIAKKTGALAVKTVKFTLES